MPDGRDDYSVPFLILGGAAVALGLLVLTRRRPNGGFNGGFAVSPCPPLGDVNGDGFITETDAQWVLEAHAGLRTLSLAQLQAADVNRDGRVNSIDAALILQVAQRLPGAGFRCDLPPHPDPRP